MDHLLAKIGQYGLVLNKENKVLILQRVNSKLWSLPGGRLSANERDWKKALVREIVEETGLDVIDAEPININIAEDLYQVKYCVYFTVKVKNTNKIELSNEHINYQYVGTDELNEINVEYNSVKEIIERYLMNMEKK